MGGDIKIAEVIAGDVCMRAFEDLYFVMMIDVRHTVDGVWQFYGFLIHQYTEKQH